MDIDKKYDEILERYQERRKLRNMINKYRLRKEGRLKARNEHPDREDERWITVGAKSPNERTGDPGRKGKHVLIDNEGKVVSGAGGSLTGVKLGGAKSTSGEVKVDPKKVEPKDPAKTDPTKVDPGSPKTTGETVTPKESVEPAEPKETAEPKTQKFGEFEHKPEVATLIDDINKRIEKDGVPGYAGKRLSWGAAADAGRSIPAGTVIEINGTTYIKYGEGKGDIYSTTGFIQANGPFSWHGISPEYSVIEKAPSIKYLGSMDFKDMRPPGADKEIKLEGNYANDVLKAKLDDLNEKMRCDPGHWPSKYSIVKEMNDMPKGSEIELEDGTIYKRYQNDWRKKTPSGDSFMKAYGAQSDFSTALLKGDVKAIRANMKVYTTLQRTNTLLQSFLRRLTQQKCAIRIRLS